MMINDRQKLIIDFAKNQPIFLGFNQ